MTEYKIPVWIEYKIPIRVIKTKNTFKKSGNKNRGFSFVHLWRVAPILFLILALLAQAVPFRAFEAHVINVTAEIVNDIPLITQGGNFCDAAGAEITMSATLAGADIIYTLDGSDPVCSIPGPQNGAIYTGPFTLFSSATVKARSCHDSKQSAIVSADFDVELKYCVCGNGVIDQGEQCDDGNNIDTDACKNNCTLPSVCEFSLDVMMVIDRSGSMGYTSKCDWWQLKCINSPSCSAGYNWVINTTYDQTQSWCNAKNQSAPHNSVWTEYSPTKIKAAKDTADNFIDLMGVADQSGLVSFANDATLDKKLSNNHSQTQAAINSLVTIGATDIGDAIKFGTAELTSIRINPSAEQIMILLTDGKANKPSGPGNGEYAPDVAYALAKADEAAAAGIKIFTIGLGADINATMLQDIAIKTNGQYYFAPTAQDLDDIFALLKDDACQEEPVCGDGVKNGTEECDGADGVGPNQSCSQTCTLTDLSYCGNGVIDPGEECDDGNQTDTDACKNDCTLPSVCEFNLDVMTVMDRSGSMNYDSPTRLSQAKIAANSFLADLGAGDQSGLVSYANLATLDKTLSNSHSATQTKVNSLAAFGATNIGDAIKLANEELVSDRINPSAEQIMILLTDGKANKPSGPGYGEYAVDVAYALAKADEAATAGIKIFTIGLGSDINAAMLGQIASATNGQYYFAPTAQDLDDIFALLKDDACEGEVVGINSILNIVKSAVFEDEDQNSAPNQEESSFSGDNENANQLPASDEPILDGQAAEDSSNAVESVEPLSFDNQALTADNELSGEPSAPLDEPAPVSDNQNQSSDEQVAATLPDPSSGQLVVVILVEPSGAAGSDPGI